MLVSFRRARDSDLFFPTQLLNDMNGSHQFFLILKQADEYMDNLNCSRNDGLHQNSISQSHGIAFTDKWLPIQEPRFPGPFLTECHQVTSFHKGYLDRGDAVLAVVNLLPLIYKFISLPAFT